MIVGDLNHHFCVHAPVQGRGAGDSGPPVIHFSGSPRLPSIPEDSASSPSTAAPDGRMVAFIRALLTRAKDEAASFALTGECFENGGDLHAIVFISILVLQYFQM